MAKKHCPLVWLAVSTDGAALAFSVFEPDYSFSVMDDCVSVHDLRIISETQNAFRKNEIHTQSSKKHGVAQ